MPSEFPMHDPQNIWQTQTTEPFKMSANELCLKAQKRQRMGRLQAVYSIAISLVLFAFLAWTCAKGGDLVPRLGLGLTSLWCLYFAYQSYQWFWPRPLAPRAPLNTTLLSYRNELEKRRDYAFHIWRRAGLTFCFLGLAMVVVPGLVKALHQPGLLMNFAPIFVLLALWLVMFFRLRKRNRRKLQREIDELLAFEKENRS